MAHGNRAHRLAEATVSAPGPMTLGAECFDVPGDTVRIAPDTPHRVAGTGRLRIFGCSSPACARDDTELPET